MRAGPRGSRKEPLARAELRRRGTQTRAGWMRGSGPARLGWGWGRRGRRSARIPPPAGVTPSIRPLCPRWRWDSVGCPVPWAAAVPRAAVVPRALPMPSSTPAPRAPAGLLVSLRLPHLHKCSFFLQLHLEPAAGVHEAKPATCPAGAGEGLWHCRGREARGFSAAARCEDVPALSQGAELGCRPPLPTDGRVRTPSVRASRGEGSAPVSHLGRSGVISAQHLGKVGRAQEDCGTPGPAAGHLRAWGLGQLSPPSWGLRQDPHGHGGAAVGSGGTNSHLYVLK